MLCAAEESKQLKKLPLVLYRYPGACVFDFDLEKSVVAPL